MAACVAASLATRDASRLGERVCAAMRLYAEIRGLIKRGEV